MSEGEGEDGEVEGEKILSPPELLVDRVRRISLSRGKKKISREFKSEDNTKVGKKK